MTKAIYKPETIHKSFLTEKAHPLWNDAKKEIYANYHDKLIFLADQILHHKLYNNLKNPSKSEIYYSDFVGKHTWKHLLKLVDNRIHQMKNVIYGNYYNSNAKDFYSVRHEKNLLTVTPFPNKAWFFSNKKDYSTIFFDKFSEEEKIKKISLDVSTANYLRNEFNDMLKNYKNKSFENYEFFFGKNLAKIVREKTTKLNENNEKTAVYWITIYTKAYGNIKIPVKCNDIKKIGGEIAGVKIRKTEDGDFEFKLVYILGKLIQTSENECHIEIFKNIEKRDWLRFDLDDVMNKSRYRYYFKYNRNYSKKGEYYYITPKEGKIKKISRNDFIKGLGNIFILVVIDHYNKTGKLPRGIFVKRNPNHHGDFYVRWNGDLFNVVRDSLRKVSKLFGCDVYIEHVKVSKFYKTCNIDSKQNVLEEIRSKEFLRKKKEKEQKEKISAEIRKKKKKNKYYVTDSSGHCFKPKKKSSSSNIKKITKKNKKQNNRLSGNPTKARCSCRGGKKISGKSSNMNFHVASPRTGFSGFDGVDQENPKSLATYKALSRMRAGVGKKWVKSYFDYYANTHVSMKRSRLKNIYCRIGKHTALGNRTESAARFRWRLMRHEIRMLGIRQRQRKVLQQA